MFKLFGRGSKKEEEWILEQKAPEKQIEMADSSFRFTVDDVFAISGRGTVITGKVERGTVKVGDTLVFRGKNSEQRVRIDGLEMFRRTVDSAGPEDYVGLLTRDISKNQVHKGDSISGS